MIYSMTKPCDQCPFLKKNSKSYGLRRLRELASGSFPCHKTAECYEDNEVSEFRATTKSLHCAGALIFCEKRNAPNQMMRIAERLGMYDRTKLDMSSVVA